MDQFNILCAKGDRAFKNDEFLQAISFYSSALSLCSYDEDVLGCRSVVYAKLGMYNESKKDADSLISVIPQKPKGHFLRAVALENLGNYSECLRSYLKAYELDKVHPTQLLLSIIQVVGCICQMSESEELPLLVQDDDCFKFNKFIQVGKRLLETHNYHICIDVISTALKAHYGWHADLLIHSKQSMEDKNQVSKERTSESTGSLDIVCDEMESSVSDQAFGFSSIDHRNHRDEEEGKDTVDNGRKRGIMTALLILTETHFSLYQYIDALALCKQCLAMALDFTDKEFEIKSYVKLANIYHRLAQYTQAISYNGKLLAVGRDLQKCDKEGKKEYWNSDLERRAVWNLSAAYKLMGDFENALHHAQEYMELLKCVDEENLVTTAYSNLGELELLQGNYEKALQCHQTELQLCKKLKDRQGAAYAYGSIGMVYAHLRSFKLAAVNHEQHLRLAQSLDDKMSELIALKNYGCMHRLMGNYNKALNHFERHLHLVKVNKMDDLLCKAYSLIGACYKELHQLHHAQYYYETSLRLALEQNDLEEELESCLALAQISASMRNFETSSHYFNKAIPVLEEKLLSKYGRSLIYQDPLLEKLDQCYKDLQEVLTEMNLQEEALEIAEHCRSRILVNILRHEKILNPKEACPSEPLVPPYSANDMVDVLSQQQASILFFSTIPSGFLLWMLSPGKGIVKCHRHICCEHYSFADKIRSCIEEIHSSCQESYNCDHLALPPDVTHNPHDTPNEEKTQRSCLSCEFLRNSKLTPLQKLYRLLLVPVENELKELALNNTNDLIVIPDLEVNLVPFPCLQDQDGQYLHEVFTVRILPCIRLLQRQIKLLQDSSSAGDKAATSTEILVQGNPHISSVDLYGKIWSPANQSDLAEVEVNTVAALLGVDPVSGSLATKDHFLKALPNASVVHLVTYGSWSDSCIALSPEAYCHSNHPPPEAFVVTISDIAMLKISAKVVVMNACCGCAHHYCQLKSANFNLALALLAAGAQSVILPLWSAPQTALLNLFCQFYSGLEMGQTVSESLRGALTQVRGVEGMSSPDFWASFVHVGFDTTVNFMKLRHEIFHRELDQAVQTSSQERFPFVTAETLDRKVPSVEIKIMSFQEMLTHLLFQHSSLPHVLPALKDVVQLAHQMLLSYQHPELLSTEDFTMCAQLSSIVLEAPGAREFLNFLGFDFQKDGAYDRDPFVVFPHWDPDGLLFMASQALPAVCDFLKVASSGGYTLAKVVKNLTKNTMEKVKQFLSLSCRYPERIMKTSDFVLRSLWYKPEHQRFLASLGFYEIGQSLLFNKTEENRVLLKSTLLLVSTMLDYIEKGKTGPSCSVHESRRSTGKTFRAKLSSKQIIINTPWMSKRANKDENEVKMALARELEGINKEFAGHVTRSNYWHARLLRAQSAPGSKLPLIGAKTLDKPTGRSQAAVKAGKVKVNGGLTASCTRRPVEEEPKLSINDTRERRNEIYRIYAQRFDDIAMHKRQKIRQLLVPLTTDHR